MRRSVVVLVFLAGCSRSWPTSEPSTPQELAVVKETALAAARHGVEVRAEIAQRACCGDTRAGWYSAGVAYFVAPEINTYPVERMRELAVHEVCHAVGGFPYPHDTRHWCCMKLDGEIGYAPPETVMGQWPTCEGVK